MRVSARGYGVLVAGVLLLVAGFVFGYPELAAVGCAAVVAMAGALAFVAWRPQLSVDRVAEPDRVMRGEPSTVTLSIRNASRFIGASLVAQDRVTHRVSPVAATAGLNARAARRGLNALAARVGLNALTARRGFTAPAARSAGTVAVPIVRLRPGRTTTVSYPVPTKRRGVIRIGPLEVSRRDPLGLVSMVRQYGEPATVWVRPRVHAIAAVPVGLSRSMDGRVDRVPQGSITFSTLREYVVGDDLRHVHWRTSARVGELMVREHVDTSLPRIVVLLDDRAAAHGPGAGGGSVAGEARGADVESTFEAACEAAASVVVAAVREDIAVELRLLSGATAAAHSEPEVGPLLDLLAEADLTPDRDLRSAVESLRVRRVGDTLVYLSGPPNEDDLGLVASLRGAYPSIIAGVFGPVESGLATTAGMLVVSAADGPDFAGAWDGIRAW